MVERKGARLWEGPERFPGLATAARPWGTRPANFKIEFEREDNGRWIAEIPELPGVMAYGASKEEAEAAVEALALTLSQRTPRHGIA